jgi:hypothetical protein
METQGNFAWWDNFEKGEIVGRITLFQFKTYYRTTVIKAHGISIGYIAKAME